MLEKLRNDSAIDPELKMQVAEFLATTGWYDRLQHSSATQQAENTYQEMVLRSETQADKKGMARAQILLGILRQRTQGRGQGHFTTAISLLAAAPDDELKAWANRELSIALRMQGRFRRSEELIDVSIKSFETQQLPFQKAHSLLNFGFLLVWTGRLRRAELSFEETMRLFASIGHVQPIESAWPLFGLGLVAKERCRYELAEKRFDEAAAIWKGDLFGTPICDTSRAEIAIARGKFSEALEILNRSEEFRQTNQDMFGFAWALRARGQALLAMNRIGEACEMLTQGRAIMRGYGSPFGESALAVGLCHAHAQSSESGDFEVVAGEIESMAKGDDPFWEHLACVNLLRGRRAIAHSGDSRSLDREQAISYFVESLTCAARHHVYLLDETAGEIAGALSGNGDLLQAVRAGWSDARIDGEAAVEWERERRSAEAVDGQQRTSVLERLASVLGAQKTRSQWQA
jgi:tetratricopeptide (TPR) repeat protein